GVSSRPAEAPITISGGRLPVAGKWISWGSSSWGPKRARSGCPSTYVAGLDRHFLLQHISPCGFGSYRQSSPLESVDPGEPRFVEQQVHASTRNSRSHQR